MTRAQPLHAPSSSPLDPLEEGVWRALARALIVVPRALTDDLEAHHDLNLAEYSVLMNLSEEPTAALRMTELANRGSLSLSGISRVVDRLVRRDLVERRRCPDDARGQLVTLTDAGLAQLKAAYPTHLESVRRHVMDHLQGIDLAAMAEAFAHLAPGEAGPPL